VVIVDDEQLVRSGFAALLASDPAIDVVGEAGDGLAAVDLIRRERPDVVLMDLRMPGKDGIWALRQVCGDPEFDSTRIIVLTTFDTEEHVVAALRAGATGFLLKDALPAELLGAIHRAAQGQAVLAPSLLGRLLEFYVDRAAPLARPPWFDLLTGREVEVLVEVARGLSNAEIAHRLHMAPATAKTHVGRLLHKIGVRDRSHLVIAAYQAGLVSVPLGVPAN
jgi:DNA-binding NarL/FixJ family response regulator